MGRRKEFRTVEWLESFTGYVHQHAAEVLRRAGIDWRAASEAEIRRAIIANLNRARAVMTRKATPIEHGGRRWTVAEFAVLVGVEPKTMLARRSRYGGWAKAVALSLATPGKWARGNATSEGAARRGRPLLVETIDGETRTRREWMALVGLTRQGLHSAAHKHGRTAAEELAARVRARRSDAAHTPASVASDPTPRMVRGGRSVSACAASGRGAASETKEVAA